MISLHWNIPLFVDSLLLMLKGLIGIFAVIVVIWGFVALLNRLNAKKN